MCYRSGYRKGRNLRPLPTKSELERAVFLTAATTVEAEAPAAPAPGVVGVVVATAVDDDADVAVAPAAAVIATTTGASSLAPTSFRGISADPALANPASETVRFAVSFRTRSS